ncbi:MAG: sugar phosphate nucleotidyltransferase [Candidatus Limnocylindrales bacterium]
MYAVVLAGGGGTRLWPLSRPECPKPFLRLLGDETLIQRTVARLEPLVSPQDVYVVTDRRHLPLVAEQLPAVPASNHLGEPMGRNTAAAVALAAEAIARPADEVMLVLPADAHVADEGGFRGALAAAGQVARGGSLVTLGVTPDRPETGYGYILARLPAREVAGHPTYGVERFVEKPTEELAVELMATGLASWNAGIFAWTRGTIRARLARHAPDILGPLRAICETGTPADLDAAYPSLRATSIDYAVMEPASVEGAVTVVPMSVGWSDLGSWATLRDAWQDAAGKSETGVTVGLGNRRDLGSTDSLVLAQDRLVVTIGLHDVIVVDTPEALLVCSGERSQEVRKIAEEMAASRRESAAKEKKS